MGKISLRLLIAAIILIAGFAAGIPVGQSMGFAKGSEWAFVQAELVAKEAGLEMPVSYDGEQFMIVMKQPQHLYQRAWKLADRHEGVRPRSY